MNTEKNIDIQQNMNEGLGNREEMVIHDDVEYEYVEEQECEVDNDENTPFAIWRSIFTK